MLSDLIISAFCFVPRVKETAFILIQLCMWCQVETNRKIDGLRDSGRQRGYEEESLVERILNADDCGMNIVENVLFGMVYYHDGDAVCKNVMHIFVFFLMYN